MASGGRSSDGEDRDQLSTEPVFALKLVIGYSAAATRLPSSERRLYVEHAFFWRQAGNAGVGVSREPTRGGRVEEALVWGRG